MTFSIPTKAAVVAGLSAAVIAGLPALAGAIPPPSPPTGSSGELGGLSTGSATQGVGPFAEYQPIAAARVADPAQPVDLPPADTELSLGN